MKIALKKIFFVWMLLIIGLNVHAQPAPVPPGFNCSSCNEPDLPQTYIDYCNNSCNTPLPVNNSIHILMATGLLFGAFVLFKKLKHKKTPM